MTAVAAAPAVPEAMMIVEAKLGGLPIAELVVPASEAPALVRGWSQRWHVCTVSSRPVPPVVPRAGVEWT